MKATLTTNAASAAPVRPHVRFAEPEQSQERQQSGPSRDTLASGHVPESLAPLYRPRPLRPFEMVPWRERLGQSLKTAIESAPDYRVLLTAHGHTRPCKSVLLLFTDRGSPSFRTFSQAFGDHETALSCIFGKTPPPASVNEARLLFWSGHQGAIENLGNFTSLFSCTYKARYARAITASYFVFASQAGAVRFAQPTLWRDVILAATAFDRGIVVKSDQDFSNALITTIHEDHRAKALTCFAIRAAQTNHWDLVSFCLQRGADPFWAQDVHSHSSDNVTSVLDVVLEGGHVDLLPMLPIERLRAPIDIAPLTQLAIHPAVQRNDVVRQAVQNQIERVLGDAMLSDCVSFELCDDEAAPQTASAPMALGEAG